MQGKVQGTQAGGEDRPESSEETPGPPHHHKARLWVGRMGGGAGIWQRQDGNGPQDRGGAVRQQLSRTPASLLVGVGLGDGRDGVSPGWAVPRGHGATSPSPRGSSGRMHGGVPAIRVAGSNPGGGSRKQPQPGWRPIRTVTKRKPHTEVRTGQGYFGRKSVSSAGARVRRTPDAGSGGWGQRGVPD